MSQSLGFFEYGDQLLEIYLINYKGIVTLALGFTLVIILFSIWLKSYLNMRNHLIKSKIPGPTPLPIFGNILDLARKSIPVYQMELIKRYGKTIGYFEGSFHAIMTTDVKLIKCCMIKDFNSFVNRRIFEPILMDPIDKFLTVLKDDEWKNVRSIVSNAFTSGKLRAMSKHMLKCYKNYDAFLDNLTTNGDGIMPTRKFFGNFSLDVISCCCFGFESNAINETSNEFLDNIQQILDATQPEKNPKLLLLFVAPRFSNFLAKRGLIEFLPRKPGAYLQGVMEQIIDRRRKKLEVRDDFIQSIIEREDYITQADFKKEMSSTAKIENDDRASWDAPLKKTLTNSEIISQALLFLAAGFETTAISLEFICYNLAMHPHVQDKLIEEVDQVLENNNGEINYDTINELKYMDQVIDESMRLYPPIQYTDRVASNDFVYEGLTIEKGQVIMVPIYALHRDPDLYPAPEEFRPERFEESAKKSRESVAFCPFGAGPRVCMGMRFALIEIKLLLGSILSKYKFEKCEKTPEKVMLKNYLSGFTKPVEPLHVKVSRR